MKIYDCIEDICNLIKLYCLSIILPFIIFIYYKLPFDTKIAVFFLAIILLSYLINSLVHHLPIFFLLHILLFLLPFNIGLTTWDKVICTLFLTVITCLDFSFWFINKEQKTYSIPLGCLVIFVALYLYSDGMKSSSFTNAIYYSGQFFIIAGLAEMYLNNMHFLPTEGNEVFQKPKKAVLIRNNTYIVTILTSILAFNCFIHLSALENLLSFLLTKLGHFFQFLISLLKFKSTNSSLEMIQETEKPQIYLPDAGEPSLVATILSYIFIAIGTLFILFILYRIILSIVRMIKENLQHRFHEKNMLDDDVIEVSEDLNIQKHHHRSQFKFSIDPRERIRKRYVQEIKHQIKHGYQNKDSYTPNERSSQLLENNQADIQDLTSCYNKARYSEHPITAMDWKHIK